MLTALRPELSAAEARVLAHAAFGLMNSTPFLGGEVDRAPAGRAAAGGHRRRLDAARTPRLRPGPRGRKGAP